MKIEVDLHTHTMASTHAYSTIIENCRAAGEKGLKAIAMTDHSLNMPDAPHVWHFENMQCLPREIEGMPVIRGIEADIIGEDGELDVPKYLFDSLEWVIASFHKPTFKPLNSEAHLKVIEAVCQNENVDMIAHPTTLRHEFDYEKGVKLLKERGIFIEINEASLVSGRSPADYVARMIKACKKYEAEIVVNTDSHFCYNIGEVSESMKMLKELDFPQKLIANASYDYIKERIRKKRPWVEL